MKEFKSEQEKMKFLIPIIARYRIFLQKYLDITRSDLIKILSRRLNKPEDQCHLSSMKTIDDCNEMIQELKKFKYELTGAKRLPEKVNPRKYAIDLKLKNKNIL